LVRTFLKEPLLHFAVLALLIFTAYGFLTPRSQVRPVSSIVVTTAKIEQMATVFSKTWQRPPSDDELKGLIDDYVAEEVLVREALALGLDQGDAVIRRRLRLKMEFMNEAEVDALTPTDADLQTYLDANPAFYQINPKIGFEQVFLNSDRRGDAASADATALLAVLQASPDADIATLGDVTLLPTSEPLTEVARVADDFGTEFAAALAKTPVGIWSGPIVSSYGIHLVRVTERQPGRTPKLTEVREAVLRDWMNAERVRGGKAQLDKLLAQYTITIEAPSTKATQP
jgi:parvulin-like peptidyl-prolyl isomerase